MADLKSRAKARTSSSSKSSSSKSSSSKSSSKPKSSGTTQFGMRTHEDFKKKEDKGHDPMAFQRDPEAKPPPPKFSFLKAFSRIPSLRRDGMNQGY